MYSNSFLEQKASELKDSYTSNLEELERKANERYGQTEQPHEHHESEHHLTTESQSFKPSSESKSLVEKELLQGTEGTEETQGKGLKEKLSMTITTPKILTTSLAEKVEQVKEMIPSMTEQQPETTEHHLKADSESFQPSSESHSLLEKAFPQGTEGTEGKGLKEKLSMTIMISENINQTNR